MTKFDFQHAKEQQSKRQLQYRAWSSGEYQNAEIDDNGFPSPVCLDALLDYIDSFDDREELCEWICCLALDVGYLRHLMAAGRIIGWTGKKRKTGEDAEHE